MNNKFKLNNRGISTVVIVILSVVAAILLIVGVIVGANVLKTSRKTTCEKHREEILNVLRKAHTDEFLSLNEMETNPKYASYFSDTTYCPSKGLYDWDFSNGNFLTVSQYKLKCDYHDDGLEPKKNTHNGLRITNIIKVLEGHTSKHTTELDSQSGGIVGSASASAVREFSKKNVDLSKINATDWAYSSTSHYFLWTNTSVADLQAGADTATYTVAVKYDTMSHTYSLVPASFDVKTKDGKQFRVIKPSSSAALPGVVYCRSLDDAVEKMLKYNNMSQSEIQALFKG